ncbi:hypothetical protein [Hymenobacter latericus]|uniref:hypothetical protein n=1 Tax=Hymenobacter sp. YIM 151858-1 TaxID=2987688 RepID=UPI0022270D37|nr:hypothetical protein [Hymenobacter sp. YIM 151858-1]UYZ59556.1 hypothetical protein OIS50_01865 [Hymenobacter sp. YIM 151858-1]
MNIQPILDHFQQLSPEEQTKEVYAHFGLAVYFGQAVEQQLANMLIFDKLFQVKPETPEQYSAIFEEYAAADKPADILAVETQLAYQLADADRDELQRLLVSRRYLADTYFKVHAQRLLQPEQKSQLVADFARFQARCRALHDRLQRYQQQYVERTGVEAELMQQTWATVVRDSQRVLGARA